MTHQRTAFAARKTANIGTASQGMKGRLRRTTSSAAPSSTAVCSSTIQRNFGSSTFAAPRGHFPLVPLGDAQLGQPQHRHGEEQTEKRNDAQVHCRSKNSALQPCPNAAASAYSPGWGGLFSIHSCRIKMIVALDRFPTFPRITQHGCWSHMHKP